MNRKEVRFTMKGLWKPIVLILVFGFMAVDLFLDVRANTKILSQQEGTSSSRDLPIGTAVGELAPDFEGSTLEGETIRLSDLRGKVVLVNAFASWCGPCRLEMPHLVVASQGLSQEDVAFVGINLQESPKAVARFRDEFGIDFPLVLDESGELTKNLYRPIGLPTSWFIDPDGVVRYVYSGAMTQDVLLRILEDVEAGREPDPFGSPG